MGTPVLPAPLSVGQSVSSTLNGIDVVEAYEIVLSSTLHTVDLTRSIKSELFSPHFAVIWTTITRRFRWVIAASHNIVHLLIVIALVTPVEVGRVIGIAIIPVGLLGSTATLLALRYDLMYVLLATYDFWFFWIVTLCTCVSLAVYVGDIRASVCFFIATGALISILVDASVSLSRIFSLSSALAGIFGLFVASVVHLQLIPNVNRLGLTISARTITLPDVIANGLLTLAVMLTRNAYRRRLAVQHKTANQSSIRCITYRCSVKLQAVSTTSAERSRRRRLGSASTVPHLLSHHEPYSPQVGTELCLVPISERFDAKSTVMSPYASIQPWSPLLRHAFGATALFAAALTGGVFCYDVILDRTSPRFLGFLAFLSSCLVNFTLWTMLQPQLFRRLVSSFDFLFVSLQLTVTHVAVGDTFCWDTRAIMVLTAYVWVHSVLLLDALTPITRRRIGFHKGFAMLLLIMYASGQGLYLTKLVIRPDWALFDRVILDKVVFGHRLQAHVVSMIFSRLPMVLTWTLRLLWRLHKSRDSDLLVIQGSVQYEWRPRKKESPTQESLC